MRNKALVHSKMLARFVSSFHHSFCQTCVSNFILLLYFWYVLHVLKDCELSFASGSWLLELIKRRAVNTRQV